MEARKTVCLAYFGDGKFLGWYSSTLGSITSNSPKLYGYTPEQMETIRGNLRHKIKTAHANVTKFVGDLNGTAAALIEAGMNADDKVLSKCREVELRVVECPFYDGPNPDKSGLDNWIYPDYADVKKWAANEPTTFLEVIK